ncbi:GUN4 domain-containing protein [Okeania sp. KiyG1]|uniref:GUN4 domain-containing protein n=1 Tax=Okeania sp. KiyG1 TaxID=2720165 RepID=UPI0019BF4343|nr:GUN4 domain-containing protein [Okeania sp. KiyG1]GGA58843.1 hypothetical protein CYANOKiyG1_80150 [Okeania sp. KiyG1]
MKSLHRILGLTFLTLTLTNCSLSSEQIFSRLEPSIVRLFYRNQPGHGTGFFVRGEKGVCTVLTAAHVVQKEGERALQTEDEKVWDVATVEIFPRDIDLALVTFRPEGGKCNYPALKIGNSESLKTGSSIYISGFPIRRGKLVPQSVLGNVTRLDNLARGYGVSYQTLTVGGMSGAPVMDEKGEVVAVHGMSDVEVVKSFASLQRSLSESERQTFQQAVERVETGVQRLTFSWGMPINLFREYRGRAIALGGEKQEVDLQKVLREVETGRQKLLQEQEAKLQKKLEEEKRQPEEVKQQEQELKAEKQKQVENEISLVSAKGVDYNKLRNLLAAGKWKEADDETERVMEKVAGRESEGWLRLDDLENFPCQDLGTIDKLWVKYSNGKFGFSFQERIYHGLGGTKEYNRKVWEAFGDKIGWRQRGEWLRYNDITFSISTPYTGHLPKGVEEGGGMSWWEVLFSRVETCI